MTNWVMRVRHLHVVLTQIHAKVFWKPGPLDSYLVLVESSQLFGSHCLASGQQVGYWVHLAVYFVCAVASGYLQVVGGMTATDQFQHQRGSFIIHTHSHSPVKAVYPLTSDDTDNYKVEYICRKANWVVCWQYSGDCVLAEKLQYNSLQCK